MEARRVQLLCGNCRRTTEVDDDSAAESIACSHCGREITIPSAETAAARYTPQEYGTDDEGGFASKVHREISRKLMVTCGACGKNLKSSRRMIGRKVRCPSCSKKILVPMPKDEELLDGVGPHIVGMDLRIADMEDQLEEALEDEALPKAELIRPGPPMWVWLAAAAALGTTAAIIIWAIFS